MRKGGIDVTVRYEPTSLLSVVLETDTLGIRSGQTVGDGFAIVSLSVNIDAGVAVTSKTLVGGVAVDTKIVDAVDLDSGPVDVRFFFSEEEISIFVDDIMVYWYCLSDSSWEIQPALKLYSIGDDVTFTSITRVELHDKREAIWIDHESTASSAIADVIQQRPVFVISKSSRHLSFTYKYGEDIVEAAFPSAITETHQENKQVSSDAIVYSSDVFISSNLQTAIEEGLLVKILKLSELDYGQVRASSAMQKSAIEGQRKIGVKDRLILALEANDIYRVNKLMSGSQRPVVFDLIVEDIDISVSDGEFGMSVSGRKVID